MEGERTNGLSLHFARRRPAELIIQNQMLLHETAGGNEALKKTVEGTSIIPPPIVGFTVSFFLGSV